MPSAPAPRATRHVSPCPFAAPLRTNPKSPATPFLCLSLVLVWLWSLALKSGETLVFPSSSTGQLSLPHPPHSPLLHPKPQFSLSLLSPHCTSSRATCLVFPWLGLLFLTLLVMMRSPAQSEHTVFVLHRKLTCNGPKVEPGCFLTHSMPGVGMAASRQC